ncbi:hypothetical protein C8F04DRAFT_1114848 [Mycena alexandri]|uniref:Apple domain-containing protein n=1 Tax=Mycena alexandri TaxID=1745969 RepID=A0AAD6SQU4_9AGAR|nr:hypothetical protein C8F04DRAFT_1114848 [Mycena alexandri]
MRRSFVFALLVALCTPAHSFTSHGPAWSHRNVAHRIAPESRSHDTSPATVHLGSYKGKTCRIRPNDHSGKYRQSATSTSSANDAVPTLVIPTTKSGSSSPMYPTLDDNVNIYSLANLVPKKQHRLYFESNDTITPKRLWSVVDFKYPTIALDHSIYIRSIACSSDILTVRFSVANATELAASWGKSFPLLLSGHSVDGCHPIHQDGPARFWAVVSAIKQLNATTLEFTYVMEGLMDVAEEVVFHIGHPDGINAPTGASGNTGSFGAGTHSTGSSGSSKNSGSPGSGSSKGSGSSGSGSSKGSGSSGKTSGSGSSGTSGSKGSGASGSGSPKGSGSSGSSGSSKGSGSSGSSGSKSSGSTTGSKSGSSGSGSGSSGSKSGSGSGSTGSKGSTGSSGTSSGSGTGTKGSTGSSGTSSGSGSGKGSTGSSGTSSGSSGSSASSGGSTGSSTGSQSGTSTSASTVSYAYATASVVPTSQDPLDESFDVALDALIGHWPDVTFGFLRSVFPGVTFYSSTENSTTNNTSTAAINARSIEKRCWICDAWDSCVSVVENTVSAVVTGVEEIGAGIVKVGEAIGDAVVNAVVTVVDVAADLAEGNFSAVLSDIGAGVIGSLESLGEAAEGVADIALGAAEVGWAAATFPSNLAAAVLPSITVNLVDTEWDFQFPPQNFLPNVYTPFGDGVLLFSYNVSSKTELGGGEGEGEGDGEGDGEDSGASDAITDALSILRREKTGEAAAGIRIYCVACALTSNFQAVGSVKYSLPATLTQAKLKLTGPMALHVEIGFELFALLSATFEKTIVEIPLIEPEIVTEGLTVGPTFQMRSEITFIVEADGYVGIGYDVEWDSDFTVTIDFSNPTLSTGDNLSPRSITPILNVGAALTFSAEAAILFGVPVGLEIFGENFEIGFWYKQSLEAAFQYAVEAYGDDDSGIHQTIESTTTTDSFFLVDGVARRTADKALPQITNTPTPTRVDDEFVPTPAPEKRDVSCQGLSVGLVAKKAAFFSALSNSYAVYTANSTLGYWCETGAPTSTDYNATATLASLSLSASATPTGAPACGGLDGVSSYTTSEQSHYAISCNTNFAGNEISNSAQSTFQSCMESCSSYNVALEGTDYGTLCLGVSYDGKTCSLKSAITTNPTSDSSYESGTLSYDGRCENGAQSFTSTVNKSPYTLNCGVDYPGNTLKSYSGVSSLEGCIDQCSTYNSASNDTSACTTYSGIIALTLQGQSSVFAVLAKASDNGMFITTGDTSSALDVQFTDCGTGPFNLLLGNAVGTTLPYLGLAVSQVDQSSYMAPGSINFLGTTPVTFPSETQVWSYDPSTQFLSAIWVNTDGSTYPMLPAIFYSSLYFAGDTTTRKSSFSDSMVPVDVHFLPGSTTSTSQLQSGCVGVTYTPFTSNTAANCFLKSNMTNPTVSTSQVDSASGSTGSSHRRRRSAHHNDRRDDNSTAATPTTSLYSFSVPTDASSTSGSVAVFDGLTNLTDVPDYTDLNQAPYVNVTVGTVINVAPTATATTTSATATPTSVDPNYSYSLLAMHDDSYYAYASEAGNIFLTPAPASSNSTSRRRRRDFDNSVINRTDTIFSVSTNGAVTFDFEGRMFFVYSDEMNSYNVSRLRLHGQSDTPYTSVAVSFLPISTYGVSPTIDALVAVTSDTDLFLVAGCMYTANHDVVKLFLVRDNSGLDFLQSAAAVDSVTGGEVETCQMVALKTINLS